MQHVIVRPGLTYDGAGETGSEGSRPHDSTSHFYLRHPLPECLIHTTTVGAGEPAPASGCCHPGLVALLAHRPADEKGN